MRICRWLHVRHRVLTAHFSPLPILRTLIRFSRSGGMSKTSAAGLIAAASSRRVHLAQVFGALADDADGPAGHLSLTPHGRDYFDKPMVRMPRKIRFNYAGLCHGIARIY